MAVYWFRSFQCCGVIGSGAGPSSQGSSTVVWKQVSLLSLDSQQQPQQPVSCLHYSAHYYPGQ